MKRISPLLLFLILLISNGVSAQEQNNSTPKDTVQKVEISKQQFETLTRALETMQRQLDDLYNSAGFTTDYFKEIDTTGQSLKQRYSDRESSFKSHNVKNHNQRRVSGRWERSRYVAGDAFVGVNLSFGLTEGDNDHLLSFIAMPTLRRNTYSASLSFGYFTSPVRSFGVRGSYKYSHNDIEISSEFLSGILGYNNFHYQHLGQGFEIAGFTRSYFPIGNSRTLYFFNEISLLYGYHAGYSRSSSNRNFNDDIIHKTVTHRHTFGLGLSPGITYFSSNRMAMEFQLGINGLQATVSKNINDNVHTGNTLSFAFRDMMNVFRGKFGFTYYFNVKK